MMEFKLTLYLKRPGKVTFTYKRSSSKINGYMNGYLRFFRNFYSVLTEILDLSVESRTVTYDLPKGFNEIAWRFIIRAINDYSELSCEITVIFIVMVEFGNHLCSSYSTCLQSLHNV